MPLPDSLLTPLGWVLRGRRPDPTLGVAHAPQLAGPETLGLTSAAFAHGGTIPTTHLQGIGPNLSPALAWSPVPEGTRALLLIMEDLDRPFGTAPGRHMVAVVDTEITALAEGELVPDHPRIRYLTDDRGRTGYQGPRPLPGHGTHRYVFHLHALGTPVGDEALVGEFETLLHAVDGAVLARGSLIGVRRG